MSSGRDPRVVLFNSARVRGVHKGTIFIDDPVSLLKATKDGINTSRLARRLFHAPNRVVHLKSVDVHWVRLDLPCHAPSLQLYNLLAYLISV